MQVITLHGPDHTCHLHRYSSSGSVSGCMVALGQQYSEGLIRGSNKRCLALLAALKTVIHAYVTPHGKEFSRDLASALQPGLR